jgi:predicted nucleic acid-binding protein
MARIVISDASPLIGLSIVDGLGWLPKLFAEVWLPEQVRSEVLSGKKIRGAVEIQAAIDSGWLRTWDKPLIPLVGIDLDEGETACINFALEYSGESLLIMDEKAGRAVATEKGLKVIGTAAIIGLAKQKGYIASARDVFETLHQSDFRISVDVIKTVLLRVGEMEE